MTEPMPAPRNEPVDELALIYASLSADDKPIAKAAHRVFDAIDAWRVKKARYEATATERERKARVNALRAELAELRRSAPERRTRRVQRGEYACEQCDRVFDTQQGTRLHTRRAHGGMATREAS